MHRLGRGGQRAQVHHREEVTQLAGVHRFDLTCSCRRMMHEKLQFTQLMPIPRLPAMDYRTQHTERSFAHTPRPLVAIAADRIERHGHEAHAVLHGYVDAVSRVAGALPLALPAALDALDADSLIATIDGL